MHISACDAGRLLPNCKGERVVKIVSWNCNGKFREKFHHILALNADIYVIQECEDPARTDCIAYKDFARNYLWTGENRNKGLGVFARRGLSLKITDQPSFCLRYFLSINVDDRFDLVAVWACKPYIEEYYDYQRINISNYNEKTVIIGDFNSNVIWDKKHSIRTHSAVVQQLDALGICSAYHHRYGETQGNESTPTFCLYRHPDKGYHIDHCFTNPKNILDYRVMHSSDWLKTSDHIPILLETTWP